MSSDLKLAIPSKGAMEETTLRFLAECGLAVRRGNSRQYRGSVGGVPGVQAVFQRAADIPQKLALGLVDAGITGFDIFSEHSGDSDDVLVVVEDLGYARCSLVLAVPEAWLDVSTFEDLADIAAEFRQRGRTLRVATKFPQLVRRFLLRNGLSSHTVVESTGALEIAPSMGYADIIADINETGATLRANRLKPIEGGTILRSQACLLVNRTRFSGDDLQRETLREVLEMIEAYQRAAEVISITANVEGASMDEVAQRVLERRDLAGTRGPSLTQVFDPDRPGRVFAVTVVVPLRHLAAVKDHLRQCGGTTMAVQKPLYLFDERSTLYSALLDRLEAPVAARSTER